MAVYSVLSMSSVATVLMAGNVLGPKHSSGRPRLRYIHRHAIPAPKPMPIGIGRELALVNQARAISSSVGRLR